MKGKLMKCLNYALCLTLLGLFTSPLWADDEPLDTPSPTATASPVKPSAPSAESTLNISFSPFVGIPVSGNTANEYNVGGGGDIYLSFQADKKLQIGLNIGLQDYTVNTNYFAQTFQQIFGSALPAGVSITGDFRVVPLMAMAKYAFNENKVRPYLLLGTGFAFNAVSAAVSYNGQQVTINATETSLLISSGLGLAFEAEDLEFFLQARMDVDFTTNNGSDTFKLGQPGAAQVTTNGNLSDDSPTIFIPIEAGLRFL